MWAEPPYSVSYIFSKEQSWEFARGMIVTRASKLFSEAKSLSIVESIKPQLPVYHTRAMQRSLFAQFGHELSSVQLAVLRYLYHDLTGDCSTSVKLKLITESARFQTWSQKTHRWLLIFAAWVPLLSMQSMMFSGIAVHSTSTKVFILL